MALARIAIIGGGPGGLTLARLLKLQKIPFRLFEQENSSKSRSQGGSLDIHAGSGQVALRTAGLFPQFEKYARREAGAIKILDKDGKALWAPEEKNPEGSHLFPDRPEIDRQDLRRILLDSLDEGQIEWGRKVVSILEDSTSTRDKPQLTVEFANGQKDSGFELVVGADGAWSRVRRLLTKEEPSYPGVTFVEARLDDVDVKHPDLAKRTGPGLCFQVNGPAGLANQRNSDGSIRTYAMVRVPEDWTATCGINWADAQTSKKALVDSKYADWDPLSKDSILRSDGPLIPRPLYMLPVEMQWETRPGYVKLHDHLDQFSPFLVSATLIGDAAHLMTPFAGEGVNLALVDALDLYEAIRSHVQDNIDWATVLQQFEAKMLARSHVAARKGFTNLTNFYEGAEGILKMIHA